MIIFKNYPKKLKAKDNLQSKRHMEEDLKIIKDSNIIRVDFETNIGNFCYYLNRRQVNKIKKDLKKPPIVTLSL